MSATSQTATRSQRGLDWLNFFVADVETGFGPFIAVYLTSEGWAPGWIGTVLTINSIAGLVARPFAGFLIDATVHKRAIVAACLGLLAAGAVLIAMSRDYWIVTAAEVMHGVAGGTLQTALVAIGLGLVGHRAFHTRVGRNHRYKAFGNALTACSMGALGHYLSPNTPFLVACALCVPALFALRVIRSAEIDDTRARSGASNGDGAYAGWRQMLGNRRLLILATCFFLFQFANAALLPLAGERLQANGEYSSEIFTAALIAVPQVVTALIAARVARQANTWGRKPMLLLGFAALPLQAALFALDFEPWYLVAVQILGGFTAAVIGILVPVVVADVTKRSGRFNVALASTNTVGIVGAAVSNTVVGFLAQSLGFVLGFAFIGGFALLGFGFLMWQLPETVDEARTED